MKVPTRNIGGWSREIIDQCSASMKSRAMRGNVFRNYFLSGSADGNPAVYNKTFAYLDNLASFLYSPVELRFSVRPYGRWSSAADRAKAHAATDELNLHIADSGTDTEIEQAVLWSLVKGKTFLKVLWGDSALESEVVQPEAMGVLRDDIMTLDRQEAFFHRTWLTRGRFWELIENHPNAEALQKKAAAYISAQNTGPDRQQTMPVMLGGAAFTGTGPYQPAGRGGSPSTGVNQNVAFWLSTPPPILAPEVETRLIPLDELWVWDSARDDWTTIQMVGDVVIEGDVVHRNLFADSIDPGNKSRRARGNVNNPIAERQPFREFCASPLDGYFWGRSEIISVGFLQETLNARVNGINALLRRQEDPPTYVSGMNGSAAQIKSRLSKPGGFLVDSSPNGKVTPMPPVIPDGLYESIHEVERWYQEMAGLPPTIQGHGDAGVRSKNHAEALTQNAAGRLQDRAMLIERQTASVGALGFQILKAKVPRSIVAWLKPTDNSIEAAPLSDPTLEPPSPDMKGIEFLLHQVPDDWRVTVDSHSGSPAFMRSAEQKALILAQHGAISNEQLIEALNPANAEELLGAAERKDIAQQKLIQEHPELLDHAGGKKKPGHK